MSLLFQKSLPWSKKLVKVVRLKMGGESYDTMSASPLGWGQVAPGLSTLLYFQAENFREPTLGSFQESPGKKTRRYWGIPEGQEAHLPCQPLTGLAAAELKGEERVALLATPACLLGLYSKCIFAHSCFPSSWLLIWEYEQFYCIMTCLCAWKVMAFNC